jgi:integrative and conjugative element protein (TIGR02256 family)
MALFAGLAADDVEATQGLADACVKIWTLRADGAVAVERRDVEPFLQTRLAEWAVRIAPGAAATIETARGDGTVETGGILLGGFDLASRTLFVTAALPSPPDSSEGRTYFDRGTRGVKPAIMEVEQATMRHITYIGEWHTHPAGSDSEPSELDRTLLRWVTDLRQLFMMPGLLLILGDDGLRVVVQKDGRIEEAMV